MPEDKQNWLGYSLHKQHPVTQVLVDINSYRLSGFLLHG